jgi:hypothetical protein
MAILDLADSDDGVKVTLHVDDEKGQAVTRIPVDDAEMVNKENVIQLKDKTEDSLEPGITAFKSSDQPDKIEVMAVEPQ